MLRIKNSTYVAGGLVFLLGSLGVVSWYCNIPILRTGFPGLIGIKANTGMALLLAGAALLLEGRSGQLSPRSKWMSGTLTFAVFAVGALTLLEYLFGWNLGLDELLLKDHVKNLNLFFPGRMSPASALSFVLIAVAIFNLDSKGRLLGLRPVPICVSAVAVITLLAFVGFFYGAATMYRTPPYSTIALPGVIGFWLLCLGIMAARPPAGTFALFTNENVYRMLPAAVLIPLLIGWLKYEADRASLSHVGFTTAIVATTLLTVFSTLLGFAATALNRAYADRERGAEAFRQSKARLDSIIFSARDAIISFDARNRIVLFNPAAEKIFKVSANVAMGEDISRFILQNSHAASGDVVEVPAVREGGELFPAEVTLSSVDAAGERLFTIILRDITERHKAEVGLLELQRREHARLMELEALMEAAPALVWIAHDPECRLITRNYASQQLLRLPPGDKFSKTPADNQSPRNYQFFKNGQHLFEKDLPMQVAGRTGKQVLCQELEVRFSDGTRRWIYGNSVPLCKEDGVVRGAVATFIDITELKRAEQELRALAERLQAVREEERTRIAREIHDVLAQELTLLKLDIAWLKRRVVETLDESKRKQLLEKLAGMSQLTGDAMLSVQRIATELRPVVLDALGLCAAIEWQAKEFSGRSNIECSANIPEDDILLDRQHSTAVFRILQESLTNVVRHANATKVTIVFQRQSRQVILTIQDNGRGIQPDEVENPTSLGLMGMRERATLMGGKCRISAPPDGGTLVEVSFPSLHETFLADTE
jgi:PAS domain S-box-containing protein